MIEEIKACPFCGTRGLDTIYGGALHAGSDSNTYWVAMCGNPECNAEILGDNEEDALKKWNRRA